MPIKHVNVYYIFAALHFAVVFVIGIQRREKLIQS